MIAVAALGLPLLFVLYISESGRYRDLSVWRLVMAGVLSGVFAVSWILLTGELVARSYGVPMATGLAIHHLLREGLAMPAGAMIVMFVPVAVVRLTRPKSQEALDGYIVGALSALTFAAIATLTRLAPQFAAGLIDHHRPVRVLVLEAVTCGVTIPLTAAAAVLSACQRPLGAGRRQGADQA